MIIGIVLGLTLAVFFASMTFMAFSFLGQIKENLVTGAVIGTGELTPYMTISMIISAVLAIIIILLIRKHHKK